MSSGDDTELSLPIDALVGRSIGGLAGQKIRFRPQLFWQEILPEHAATPDLEFHCHLATGRNFGRIAAGKDVAAHGAFARSMAKAVPEADVPPDEARLVGRALREAATYASGSAESLRHLLTSCHCTVTVLPAALCECARHGHVEAVKVLLAAGAVPTTQSDGKTALHISCEAGHEEVASALIAAEPATLYAVSDALGGRTALEVARDNDLGPLARRLEALGRSVASQEACDGRNHS
jgi:hypothetical protein